MFRPIGPLYLPDMLTGHVGWITNSAKATLDGKPERVANRGPTII